MKDFTLNYGFRWFGDLFLLPSFCYSSRKELRSKELGQEALIELGHSVDYNRIDPSRVVQLSWRPRSGTLMKFIMMIFYQVFSFDEMCKWHVGS